MLSGYVRRLCLISEIKMNRTYDDLYHPTRLVLMGARVGIILIHWWGDTRDQDSFKYVLHVMCVSLRILLSMHTSSLLKYFNDYDYEIFLMITTVYLNIISSDSW